MAFIINTTGKTQAINFLNREETVVLRKGERQRINYKWVPKPKKEQKIKILSESCHLILNRTDLANSSPLALINTTDVEIIIDLYYKRTLMYGIVLKPFDTVCNQGQFASTIGFRDPKLKEDYFIEKFNRIIIIKKKPKKKSIFIGGKKYYPSGFMPVWVLMNNNGIIKFVTHREMDIPRVIACNPEQKFTTVQTTFNMAYKLMRQQKFIKPRIVIPNRLLVMTTI